MSRCEDNKNSLQQKYGTLQMAASLAEELLTVAKASSKNTKQLPVKHRNNPMVTTSAVAKKSSDYFLGWQGSQIKLITTSSNNHDSTKRLQESNREVRHQE